MKPAVTQTLFLHLHRMSGRNPLLALAIANEYEWEDLSRAVYSRLAERAPAHTEVTPRLLAGVRASDLTDAQRAELFVVEKLPGIPPRTRFVPSRLRRATGRRMRRNHRPAVRGRRGIGRALVSC